MIFFVVSNRNLLQVCSDFRSKRGFTITFYAYGREIRVHDFLYREVREMKRMVEER